MAAAGETAAEKVTEEAVYGIMAELPVAGVRSRPSRMEPASARPIYPPESSDRGEAMNFLKRLFSPASQAVASPEEALREINALGRLADRKMCGAWKMHGRMILDSLPVTDDPKCCLDGVHEFYARYASPLTLPVAADRIHAHLAAKFASVNSRVTHVSVSASGGLTVCIDFEFSDRSHSGESICMVRSGRDQFRGCLSTNDAAYHFD